VDGRRTVRRVGDDRALGLPCDGGDLGLCGAPGRFQLYVDDTLVAETEVPHTPRR